MSAISVSWLNVSWGAVYFETNYGLMQHSFTEIKDKLLRALDAEYNVVDLATVFEVVDLLERTPITKEALESTRLGKLINECRRKTDNPVLAKRAKDLVRYWRNMMLPTDKQTPVVSPSALMTPASTSSTPHQNGTNLRSPTSAIPDRIPASSVSPALCTTASTGRNNSSNAYDKVSPSSSLSPVRDPKVESVPKTHVANKRLRKNASSPSFGEPPAKVSKVNGAMVPEAHEIGEDSVDSDFLRVRDLVPVTVEDDEQPSSSLTSAAAAASVQQTVVTESVPDPDPPLPRKRRKKASKKKASEDDIVKEKLVALSKTVRVKTTEELVAELKSRTEDRLQASTSDSQTCNNTANSTFATSTNNSVKPSLSNNIMFSDHPANAQTDTRSRCNQVEERLDPETRVEREIAGILSKLPPLNVDEICWESPAPSPEPSTPKPVTEEDVERYLSEQWDGVNGCGTHGVLKTDEDNGFREWHEMVSRRTMNDDLIHILPYSIAD